MSRETPDSPTSMNSGDSSTDSERTLSDIPLEDIPPAVIDSESEEDETTSALSGMLAVQGPRILGNKPLDVAPLSIIRPREQEVPVPGWLKGHDSYKHGEWKVFYRERSDGRKDWFYTHREYCKKFRSAREVKLFLNAKGTNKLFKGRKLRKKKTSDPNGQGRGATKPTRERKAASNRGSKANSTSRRDLTIGHRPMMPDMPVGSL